MQQSDDRERSKRWISVKSDPAIQNPARPHTSAVVMQGFLAVTMPTLAERVIENHKLITLNFAAALEREIRRLEDEATAKVLIQYAEDFYSTGTNRLALSSDSALAKNLSGLGSRFMAVCQDNFQLQLRS